MESKVVERFRREWPRPIPEHERIIGFLTETYGRYCGAGLADRHFGKELAAGSECVYQQRVGELLLAHELWNDGFKLSSTDEGPDFFAEKNGSKGVWQQRCQGQFPAGAKPDWGKTGVEKLESE